MKKTLKALKKAVKAGVKVAREPIAPESYQAGGKKIACSHCAATKFATPVVPVGEFYGWTLQCANCGHLELFAKKPQELE